MDLAALAQLVDFVGIYKQDSLLMIRHGKIVADAYYAPYAPNIRHDLRSVTKSFIGTLTGIEVQEGLLDGVDHPIVDLFPDKHISNVDEAKKSITVQNMLDMTSGIAWSEDAYTPDETIIRMYKTPDPTEFVLSQPMSDPPGARFYYNGGNPYVLSALITKKAERDALDFARDELFKPLGISSVRWGEPDAQGVTDGESGLYLAPHDMAKLGYLYLHDGLWDGQQIIPSSWVDRVREGPVTATDGYHYANLWWSLPDRGAFMARGCHSQIILVLPKLDVVAVMTGALKGGYVPTTDLLIALLARSIGFPLPPDFRRASFACRINSKGGHGTSLTGRSDARAGENHIGENVPPRGQRSACEDVFIEPCRPRSVLGIYDRYSTARSTQRPIRRVHRPRRPLSKVLDALRHRRRQRQLAQRPHLCGGATNPRARRNAEVDARFRRRQGRGQIRGYGRRRGGAARRGLELTKSAGWRSANGAPRPSHGAIFRQFLPKTSNLW